MQFMNLYNMILMGAVALAANRALAALPDFEREVAPILVNHCLECHHSGKTSGQLNLATAAGLGRGGESGPAVTTGKPDESLLIDRVAAGEMPPQEQGKQRQPLSNTEISMLRAWIEGGAAWPKGRELGLHEQTVQLDLARDFWSFQPIRRPPVPQIKHPERVANPIDAFIGAKLEASGLEPAPPAALQALVRRAYLDLVGLPPSLSEQEEFLGNFPASPPSSDLASVPDTQKQGGGDAEQVYAALIDRLLASPHYGERWARHWLDLVRYADSNGYERDASKPSVWRYRDYVIDALNRDKPYDRFVIEQLAGDELRDRTAETVIATGFHGLGAWQDEIDPLEAAQYRADELDDMLRTTAQTFLGLTLGCARCHNHKFDPLSMVDYYSLSAILAPLKHHTNRDQPAGSWAELATLAARDQKIADLNRQMAEIRDRVTGEWLESGESKLPAEAVAANLASSKERKAEQTKLVEKHAAELRAELTAYLPEADRRAIADREQNISRLRLETPDLSRAYFLSEASPTPPPAFLLLSGRASNPGPVMQPRVPAVLTQTQPIFPVPDQHTSRRRLALAEWLVDPANPLVARVIVNRVWQHHFGQGIVTTPSDFGHLGARPTHPELLDWLAHWFVHDAHWSLKKLHRLIMTSYAYRTRSMADARLRELDPENELLGRFPYRRLDVESIRDSILATSGKLNRTLHGPAVYLPIPAAVIEAHTDKEKAWQVSSEPDVYRRTVYAYVKRTLLVPMIEVLDFCDTTNSTEKRSITSIAPQALTLYNGEFVNQQAEFFAQRLVREVGDDPARQIERAYRLALCRPPTASEAAALRRFLEEENLAQMCRVIFNLNEFVYAE